MVGGIVLGVMILLAASSLGLMEKALGPDSNRFPCVTRELLWASRLLTLVLAFRGFFVLVRAHQGTLPPIAPDQYLASFALMSFLLLLLMQIIRQRLPIGVWRRLQARHARTRKAASVGGVVGATLARATADGDPVIVAPTAVLPLDVVPEDMLPALEKLARQP